ncbi:MAG: DUF2335 domain-containing protein [Nitrospirae bacterium YQR-1]
MSKKNKDSQLNISNPLPPVKTAQYLAHTGPIPDPVTLQGYERIIPGLAERIVKMAEDEVKHRHKIDDDEQKHRHKIDNDFLSLNRDSFNIESKERKLGQIFGIIIGLAGLIASVICVSFNAQTTASIIGGTTVVGLVTVFVVGEKLKSSKQSNDHE